MRSKARDCSRRNSPHSPKRVGRGVVTPLLQRWVDAWCCCSPAIRVVRGLGQRTWQGFPVLAQREMQFLRGDVDERRSTTSRGEFAASCREGVTPIPDARGRKTVRATGLAIDTAFRLHVRSVVSSLHDGRDCHLCEVIRQPRLSVARGGGRFVLVAGSAARTSSATSVNGTMRNTSRSGRWENCPASTSWTDRSGTVGETSDRSISGV